MVPKLCSRQTDHIRPIGVYPHYRANVPILPISTVVPIITNPDCLAIDSPIERSRPAPLEGVYTNAEFTLDNVTSKPHHTDYSRRLLEFEPTFHVSSRPDLPYGTIPAPPRPATY
jgi:hypothetical protein